MKKVGILISGRGSNMVALLDAMSEGRLNASCSAVISNVPTAPGIETARGRGVRVEVIDHRTSASREEHDSKILAVLKGAGTDILCLAGYMRIVSPVLIRAFQGRILNIHPALLPAFPGLNVQKKAIEHGARFSGCTVHIVDEEVDHGPIILQAAVPVFPDDTPETLSERILKREHRLYPAAVDLLCRDRVKIEGGQATLLLTREEYLKLMGEIEKGLEDG